jgi:hypothetical protein
MPRRTLALVFGALIVSACASTESVRPNRTDPAPIFDPVIYQLPQDISMDDLALEIEDRGVVESASGENLLRVRFSFISFRGYPQVDDVHRSSGVIFFPVAADGRADPANATQMLVTEFPPGSSAGGFPLYEAYGEHPAIQLGIPAAIIDLRGPILATLRLLRNPSDPADGVFRSEEQFALTKLHEFAETGSFGALYEQRIGQAWLRALKCINRILANEVGEGRRRFMLAGEGYGALGALQAAASYQPIEGLVVCGWPLDWLDKHFVAWRRWEREAHYYPLEHVQPCPYADSQDLISFLSSSFHNPDPGCPTCLVGGEVWMAQFNYLNLRAAGALSDLQTFFLFGDSDPNLPIDLELRASVPPKSLRSFPAPPGPNVDRGPFSRELPMPFSDLAYVRGSTATLAHSDAAAAVVAWVQHLAGFRDIPIVSVDESEQEGQVQIDVSVIEGNAAVTGVEVYLVEIEDGDDSDFRHPLHRQPPEPMEWRRVDGIYSGHTQEFRQEWRSTFQFTSSMNRAYMVIVRDRVGNLESPHSLPIRTLWYLGDPAVGKVRL